MNAPFLLIMLAFSGGGGGGSSRYPIKLLKGDGTEITFERERSLEQEHEVDFYHLHLVLLPQKVNWRNNKMKTGRKWKKEKRRIRISLF